jgi:hypothetical protein
VLVIGIVDNALYVAFVIAYFEFEAKGLFHSSGGV